jgi:hypothetical protein
MAEIFANDGQAVVTSGGTTAPSPGTVETWTLAGSTLPVLSGSQFFYAADDAPAGEPEKFLFTANNGTTATVTRGADGSSTVAHAAGFSVSQVIARATLQGLLPLSGGTMTGPVTLPGNPSSALQAAPKQYVDNHAGITDWINAVTQYGADPTGATDSTTAIQNAINAGTGPVYLPAGAYRISSPLTLANGTIIIGDSGGGYGGAYPPGISEITLTNGSNCSMILAPATANYWKLGNLLLNANGANQTGPAQTGTAGAVLHVEDAGSAAELQAELDCVFIEDSYNDALYLGLNRRALYARRCKFNDAGLNGTAVYGVGNGVTCNYSDHVFDACQIGNSRHHGIYLKPSNAASIRITNCDIFTNGQDWASVSSTTVAAGSNGQAVSGLTTAGVLNVASTAGFPSSASLFINVSTGPVVVSYTGTSGGNQFTGVAVSSTQGNQGGTLATGQSVYLLGGDGIHVGSGAEGVWIAGNSLDRNQGAGLFIETSPEAIKVTGNHFGSNSAIANGLLPHIMIISPDLEVCIAGNGMLPLGSGYTNEAAYFVQGNGSGSWFDVANAWLVSALSTGKYTNNYLGIQPFSNGTFLAQAANSADVTAVLRLLSGQTADLLDFQASNGTLIGGISNTGIAALPAYSASGLTGATSASRYVGAIASGTAPTSGTFSTGDWAVVLTGGIIVCTAGGTSGTWVSIGGGSGTVTSVTAGDTSIVVGGTGAAPTIETGTLDVIATDHPPAGSWSNNSQKITSLANGSGAQDAAAYGQTLTGGALGPMTTKGDLVIANATPAPARLAVGSAGQTLGVSSGLPAWGMGMTLLATTTATGVALTSGTPTLLTWTAPNDGNMHRVLLVGELVVSSTETGGKVTVSFTDPAGGAHNGLQIYASALGAGAFGLPGTSSPVLTLIQANTAFTVAQAVGLSGGAAIFYGELWGS